MTVVTVSELIDDASTIDTQIDNLVEHVKESGSEFLLLPEMPFTPWICAQPSVNDLAWQHAVDKHNDGVKRIASLQVKVGLTAPVLDQGKRLNRAMIVNKEKIESVHDKSYLPNEEAFWESSVYEAGPANFEPVLISGFLLGFMICTEIWFQQHARQLAQKGARVIANPRANYPEDRALWEKATCVVAFLSGTFVMTSNLLQAGGADEGARAGAWVVNPDGEIIVETSFDKPFASVDIDLNDVTEAQKRYPCYIR